ncbi:hypothetical protein E2C01_069398 [Portunus trituberculatus]|uniref:Uncharacterized protein n=1 Tax=Portunus trituberculatus TaxID=210409 RepID=A0A5B7HYS6_PORTR|nr:hypothetical protein [Portunus trituberculatus]
MKLKPATHVPNKVEKVARVRKTRGGAILDPCDHVGEVLDDNDFVSVERQWNHACFGVRGVSKRTDSNPVYGLSVGWASSLGATVS